MNIHAYYIALSLLVGTQMLYKAVASPVQNTFVSKTSIAERTVGFNISCANEEPIETDCSGSLISSDTIVISKRCQTLLKSYTSSCEVYALSRSGNQYGEIRFTDSEPAKHEEADGLTSTPPPSHGLAYLDNPILYDNSILETKINIDDEDSQSNEFTLLIPENNQKFHITINECHDGSCNIESYDKTVQIPEGTPVYKHGVLKYLTINSTRSRKLNLNSNSLKNNDGECIKYIYDNECDVLCQSCNGEMSSVYGQLPNCSYSCISSDYPHTNFTCQSFYEANSWKFLLGGFCGLLVLGMVVLAVSFFIIPELIDCCKQHHRSGARAPLLRPSNNLQLVPLRRHE